MEHYIPKKVQEKEADKSEEEKRLQDAGGGSGGTGNTKKRKNKKGKHRDKDKTQSPMEDVTVKPETGKGNTKGHVQSLNKSGASSQNDDIPLKEVGKSGPAKRDDKNRDEVHKTEKRDEKPEFRVPEPPSYRGKSVRGGRGAANHQEPRIRPDRGYHTIERGYRREREEPFAGPKNKRWSQDVDMKRWDQDPEQMRRGESEPKEYKRTDGRNNTWNQERSFGRGGGRVRAQRGGGSRGNSPHRGYRPGSSRGSSPQRSYRGGGRWSRGSSPTRSSRGNSPIR